MIIHLHNLANQLPYAFFDAKKVTKSHIPYVNAPTQIEVPEGHKANESKTRLKRIGSKDITLRKRRTQIRIDTPKEVHDKQNVTPPTLALADEGGARLYWDSLPTFSDIGGTKSYN